VRTVALAFGSGILGREERTRGELAHRILELVEYAESDALPVLERVAERAAREMREDPGAARAVARILADMIAKTELRAFFARAPGRTVLREQEVCNREGRLFRMDRVVIDPGRVTVIDFKTGIEEPQQHAAQVQGYREILRGVYPDAAVEALIAYVDQGTVRRVE
jgi:ATP-dependent exoDNAse (exonuclease V) beta subunit